MSNDYELAKKVAKRVAFKYDPKEKKQSKVDRLKKVLKERVGLSNGVSEDIADALVRNREVERLAIQKSWPLTKGTLEGPKGTMTLEELKAMI